MPTISKIQKIRNIIGKETEIEEKIEENKGKTLLKNYKW
jgi:hypothetical protein